MYLAYSADPQMRINIGIRRRLAPLIDNNRRRIELLNSLLFSFPGTPILYYGDELGMGDNIYLGDRNGVRTPMQWNADRNAGFSRVNPAKLYSPVIMDPVFGYQSVNVEAQQEDSSSLLNWMRNMIALRKLFQVFGRGSMEFFHPDNRKILAYFRCYGEDRILCVANLSRFAQPVELDLSPYAGMIPTEMLGYVEFPKIGKTPYALTLGPYGFLWFELHGEPENTEFEEITEEEEPTLVLSAVDPWEFLFQNGDKAARMTRALQDFLPQQRWFGNKTEVIKAIHIRDWGRVPDSSAAVVIAGIAYQGGTADVYCLPISLALGEAAANLQDKYPAAVLCSVRVGDDLGVVYDSTYDNEACQAFLSMMRRKSAVALSVGRLQVESGKALSRHRKQRGELKVHRSKAEQSNSSILFGNRFILKLFRKLGDGTNPDCEIGRFLTEHAGFDGIPPYSGSIEYVREGAPVTTLAMLQGFVENQGDGWQWTLEELRRYFERCGAREKPSVSGVTLSYLDLCEKELPAAAIEQVGIYYDSAVALGRKTAAMHLALASSSSDPAFSPEPFTINDAEKLSAEFSEQAVSVFDTLKDNLARLPDEHLEKASLVLSLRRKLLNRFADLRLSEVECMKIRVHGDYHLGQVLHVEGDYVILDFEGEPARSIEDRRAKQCAIKDIAGMLRSFSYAAHASLFAYAARGPDEADRLEPCARYWEHVVSAAFLLSYRATAADASFLPKQGAAFRRLLEAFLLDKALYELRYELNNRPTWVGIPLSGILMLERGAGAND
jgi:maltose alpha-D-glucosyltransferase/alpha-amylase